MKYWMIVITNYNELRKKTNNILNNKDRFKGIYPCFALWGIKCKKVTSFILILEDCLI